MGVWEFEVNNTHIGAYVENAIGQVGTTVTALRLKVVLVGVTQ